MNRDDKPLLIQTKLHRPLLPIDLVPRPQLTDWLDERRNRPLTLVSAPAGYGKSTLISSWLDTCKYANADRLASTVVRLDTCELTRQGILHEEIARLL